MTRTRRCGLLATGILLVLLAACAATQPTSFYTLSADTGGVAAPRAQEGLTVGLGPVTLPAYLDRPDIVTREGPNQMRLAEFHRWAEPLEPLLARIMAQDLHALLDAEDVIPVPQRRDIPLDRVVEIEVNQLDADQAGQVVFDARWWVYEGNGDTLLASGRSRITEQGAAPPDYESIAAAMSRAVAGASRDIATAIRGGAPVPTPKRGTGAGAASAPAVLPRPGS
jgi:uncharacterized lipoprotein YmbA